MQSVTTAGLGGSGAAGTVVTAQANASAVTGTGAGGVPSTVAGTSAGESGSGGPSGGAMDSGGSSSGGASSASASGGGSSSGGASSTGVGTTTGDQTTTGGSSIGDDAIRVPQMTSCEGETSGLTATAIYHVTPNGSGDGSSFAAGMSLQAALAAVQAGEMILLEPGTYVIPVVSSTQRNTIVLSKSGRQGAPISMVAANCGRALFDFSYPANEWQSGDGKGFGFQLTGNYWYLKNLDVTNAGYHGIYIGGETADPSKGQYNTIENCSFFNNRNTGLEINKGGAHNTIINTDSYENYDFKLRDDGTMGGMADGFASKEEQGPGNQFFGCRAWGNSDDGFDTFANTDPVNIETSWAFENGIDIWGSAFWQSLGATFRGNGNGFKLGGSDAKQRNRVVNSVAFGNPANGFDLNSNVGGQTLYNNLGYQNGKNYDFDSQLDSGEQHSFRNNISLAGAGSDVFQDADSANNTWNSIPVSTSDFVSLNLELATVPRNPDGSLPLTGLFQLVPASALIDAGTDVGLPYAGARPDLGPYEAQ